jgi:hypothetical protein
MYLKKNRQKNENSRIWTKMSRICTLQFYTYNWDLAKKGILTGKVKDRTANF